jgi:hypothetical protein
MLALKEDSKLEALPSAFPASEPFGQIFELMQRLLMWGTNCGDGGITALLELLRKNALTVRASGRQLARVDTYTCMRPSAF